MIQGFCGQHNHTYSYGTNLLRIDARGKGAAGHVGVARFEQVHLSPNADQVLIEDGENVAGASLLAGTEAAHEQALTIRTQEHVVGTLSGCAFNHSDEPEAIQVRTEFQQIQVAVAWRRKNDKVHTAQKDVFVVDDGRIGA